MLLPYIDQAPLYNTINFNIYFDHGSNTTQRRTKLVAFLCPSDSPYPGSADMGNCNYPGSMGPSLGQYVSPLGLRNGFFNFDVITRVGDVRDGTSNTISMSEHFVGDNNNSLYTPGDVVRGVAYTTTNLTKWTRAELDAYGAACDAAKANHHSHNGREWMIGQPAQTLFNTLAPPNHKWPNCQDCTGCGWMDSRGVFPARSRHTGGVHTQMGDGSVRFITENIDLALWQNLGSINGGETLGEF
jgi:hypothetical protein